MFCSLRADHFFQQQTNEIASVCKTSSAKLMMSLDSSFGGAILLAEEIFAQVAAGGVAIIISGFVGALFVGKFANLEALEKDFEEKNLSENEKRARLAALSKKLKSDTIPPELQNDVNDRFKSDD